MATRASNLQAQGWRYDATANRTGGWVRPDTRWNAGTGRFDTPNSVGGTIFVPNRTGSGGGGGMPAAAGGVSSLLGAAPTVSFSSVAMPAAVRADLVRATMAESGIPTWDSSIYGSGTVRAQSVDPFGVADTGILQELERQAEADLALGGRLSDQEERAAIQASRAALSDRGMLMSTPAAVAEVLARDAASRERMDARRSFAAGVSSMLSDLDVFNAQQAQTAAVGNADRRLQADLANQGLGLERWQTEAELGNRTSLRNADAMQSAAVGNADRRLQAAMANQGAALDVGRINSQGALQAAMANQGVLSDRDRLLAEDAWRRMSDATERYGISASLQRAASGNYTGPVGGYGTRPAASGTSWSTLLGAAGLPADMRPYTPLGGSRLLASRSTGTALPYAQGLSMLLGAGR